jgi:hypothetical protein
MNTPEIPIVCNLNAISDRAAHAQAGALLFAQTASVTELEDGYTIKFPVDALPLAAQFVDGERRCCPFLTFELVIRPAADCALLRLTGTTPDVKAFLKQELLPQLPDTSI